MDGRAVRVRIDVDGRSAGLLGSIEGAAIGLDVALDGMLDERIIELPAIQGGVR